MNKTGHATGICLSKRTEDPFSALRITNPLATEIDAELSAVATRLSANISACGLSQLTENQPIRPTDTLEGDSILQMEVNRLSQQVELLQEQVARLQEQQFVFLDGKRGTLEQLADEVAERLKERANLW